MKVKICLWTESVLISTYWNVNTINGVELTQEMDVLISTYWNVNPTVYFPIYLTLLVLISTYWNVNEDEFMCVQEAVEF